MVNWAAAAGQTCAENSTEIACQSDPTMNDQRHLAHVTADTALLSVLRFYISLDTKQVFWETFFPANLMSDDILLHLAPITQIQSPAHIT